MKVAVLHTKKRPVPPPTQAVQTHALRALQLNPLYHATHTPGSLAAPHPPAQPQRMAPLDDDVQGLAKASILIPPKSPPGKFRGDQRPPKEPRRFQAHADAARGEMSGVKLGYHHTLVTLDPPQGTLPDLYASTGEFYSPRSAKPPAAPPTRIDGEVGRRLSKRAATRDGSGGRGPAGAGPGAGPGAGIGEYWEGEGAFRPRSGSRDSLPSVGRGEEARAVTAGKRARSKTFSAAATPATSLDSRLGSPVGFTAELQRARARADALERKLNLLYEIDAARDAHKNHPRPLLQAICDCMQVALAANTCMLYMTNATSRRLENDVVVAQGSDPDLKTKVPAPLEVERALRKSGAFEGAETATTLIDPGLLGSMSLPRLAAAALTVIRMDGEMLGVMLLVRGKGMFGKDDVDLIQAASTQIDSAIVQIYARFELVTQSKAAAVLREISLLRMAEGTVKDHREAILAVLARDVADLAFLFSWDAVAGSLVLLASHVPSGEAWVDAHTPLLLSVADAARTLNRMVLASDLNASLRRADQRHPEGLLGGTVVCFPLARGHKFYGVFGIALQPVRRRGWVSPPPTPPALPPPAVDPGPSHDPTVSPRASTASLRGPSNADLTSGREPGAQSLAGKSELLSKHMHSHSAPLPASINKLDSQQRAAISEAASAAATASAAASAAVAAANTSVPNLARRGTSSSLLVDAGAGADATAAPGAGSLESSRGPAGAGAEPRPPGTSAPGAGDIVAAPASQRPEVGPMFRELDLNWLSSIVKDLDINFFSSLQTDVERELVQAVLDAFQSTEDLDYAVAAVIERLARALRAQVCAIYTSSDAVEGRMAVGPLELELEAAWTAGDGSQPPPQQWTSMVVEEMLGETFVREFLGRAAPIDMCIDRDTGHVLVTKLVDAQGTIVGSLVAARGSIVFDEDDLRLCAAVLPPLAAALVILRDKEVRTAHEFEASVQKRVEDLKQRHLSEEVLAAAIVDEVKISLDCTCAFAHVDGQVSYSEPSLDLLRPAVGQQIDQLAEATLESGATGVYHVETPEFSCIALAIRMGDNRALVFGAIRALANAPGLPSATAPAPALDSAPSSRRGGEAPPRLDQVPKRFQQSMGELPTPRSPLGAGEGGARPSSAGLRDRGASGTPTVSVAVRRGISPKPVDVLARDPPLTPEGMTPTIDLVGRRMYNINKRREGSVPASSNSHASPMQGGGQLLDSPPVRFDPAVAFAQMTISQSTPSPTRRRNDQSPNLSNLGSSTDNFTDQLGNALHRSVALAGGGRPRLPAVDLGLVRVRAVPPFSISDRRVLSTICSQFDSDEFHNNPEVWQLKRILARSVDAKVMASLVDSGKLTRIVPERKYVTVMFIDLRGSTALAEAVAPEVFVKFINQYLANASNAILEKGGVIDKFVGDEVMALFGAPLSLADAELCAIQAAREVLRSHEQDTLPQWTSKGITNGLGIGIASGELLVGEVGCSLRTDYTVIGRSANLASRLCSKAGANEILVDASTYKPVEAKFPAEPIANLNMKGIPEGTIAYKILR